MMTKANINSYAVLQDLAHCSEILTDIRRGRLYYLIDEDWVDVTNYSLGDIIDLIS